MKKGMSKTQKWALVAGAALLALLILAAAAALYINSKMSLLSRPAAASANAESITPEDSILSFANLNLDDIDVMENGGTIEPCLLYTSPSPRDA